MRVVALIVLASCGGAPPAPKPAAPDSSIGHATATCSEAAVGLEQATRGVRAPDSSVLMAMRSRCTDDNWPAAAAHCFALMHEGDLGHCARMLPDDARNRMFVLLGGGQPDRMAITIARARLEGLQVGVGACNDFVSAVATVLTCEQMPIDARVQLGNETADFWDLPTHGLPDDARKRMTDACGASLAELQQEAHDAGCML
jgi:hypothetical protein